MSCDPKCEMKVESEELGMGEFMLCGECDHEWEADCEHEASEQHRADDPSHEARWVPNDLWQRMIAEINARKQSE